MLKLNLNPTILKAAWEKNLEVRPEKDWNELKGRCVVMQYNLKESNTPSLDICKKMINITEIDPNFNDYNLSSDNVNGIDKFWRISIERKDGKDISFEELNNLNNRIYVIRLANKL